MRKLIQALAVAAALSAAVPAHADEAAARPAGKPERDVVAFNIGDSKCELRNDQVQCSRVER